MFSQKGYDKMVDWWSMGVIMFECLVGYPPFYAEDPLQTCRKIVHYRKYFKIPYDAKLSKECADLIHNLVCSYRRRFSFEQIKSHSFFKIVKFDKLYTLKPPFIPNLSSDIDTSNFETIEAEQDMVAATTGKKDSKKKKDNAFVDYTFKPQDFSKIQNIMNSVDSANGNAATYNKSLPQQPKPNKPKINYK